MHNIILKIFFCMTTMTAIPLYVLISQSSKDTLRENYSEIDTITMFHSLPKLVFKVKYDTLRYKYTPLDGYVVKIEIYKLNESMPIQVIADTENVYPYVETDDVNWDSYPDIRINYGYAYLTESYKFWLFDPGRFKFIYSKEFSALNNYSTDTESDAIVSETYELGGRGGTTTKYHIIDNHLVIFESSESYEDEYEKQILVNGKMQIVEQSKAERCEDGLEVVTDKKLIFDSLRVTVKTWRTDFEGDLTEEQENNPIFQVTTWGRNYSLLRKENYTYNKLKNGKIKCNVTHYEVVNGNWKKK